MTTTVPSDRDATVRAPRWTWVLAVTMAVVGTLAVVVRPTAPPLPPPGPVDAVLTSFLPATLDQVAAWVGPIRVANLLAIALRLAVPALLLGTVRGRRLLGRVGGSRAATWRGAAAVVLATALATAPLRWWIGWRHAGAFGFRTSSPTRFVLEALGDVALEVLAASTSAALVLWLVRRRPHDWPAAGAIVGTVLTAGVAVAWPLVVTPVLLAPTPLEDPAVTAVIAPLLATSEVDAPVIEVGAASVRTTRVNALVTGYGPSRRIILYDTLVERPPSRVAAVVAHELAHAEHHDVERAVLASAVGILLGLLAMAGARRWWLRRRPAPPPAVAGAMVVAAVVVLELVTSPLVALESRRAEAAADHRALELTGDPGFQVDVHRGFVVEDLADPTPPTWSRLLSSHPTASERIRAAVAFAEERGLDPTPTETGAGG